MAETLCVGPSGIAVRLRRNPRARRMVLRVSRSGIGPSLTVPPGVSLRAARAFLDDKAAWLRDRIADAPPRTVVGIGVRLPLGGEIVEIAVGEPGRAGSVLGVAGPPAKVAGQVAAYLRTAAHEACVAAVARHAGRLGAVTGRVRMRDPRSRWGSCSTAGDLMFSWRLIMAPPVVLDYVAAHEVAHLVEMNHSARFWSQVRGLCPEYEAPQAWLRREGAGLHAFDFSPAFTVKADEAH